MARPVRRFRSRNKALAFAASQACGMMKAYSVTVDDDGVFYVVPWDPKNMTRDEVGAIVWPVARSN